MKENKKERPLLKVGLSINPPVRHVVSPVERIITYFSDFVNFGQVEVRVGHGRNI